MEQKNLKLKSATTFIHLSGASYEILKNFKRLIEGNIISSNDVNFMRIHYDTSKGIANESPAKIFFNNSVAVFLELTAGYGGNGPRDLCQVISLCFPEFDKKAIEKDILTTQDTVDIIYAKDTLNLYQFACNGEYYYSFN